MRFGVAHRTCNLVCDLLHKQKKNVILVGHQIADAANCICDLQQIAHEIELKIARVISHLTYKSSRAKTLVCHHGNSNPGCLSLSSPSYYRLSHLILSRLAAKFITYQIHHWV
jgi:hypothetical protein